MRHGDWSNPFPFHKYNKSSFQECITIIVLKIEHTRNQPPYCLLQLQEKMVFHLPRSGCLGTPVALPQSLYGQTDRRTDGWTYTDVRTKIFRINGLPNFLTHGAPRAPLKRKLHGGLKIWILFSRGKKQNILLAALFRKILFLPLENKIHIFAPPCNILYLRASLP